MIRRRPLASALLQDSDDALRAVASLLDDVAPMRPESGPSSLDLHLALGLLDRIYQIESTGDADDIPDAPGR